MKVIVGSENEPKLRSVKQAFTTVFSDELVEVQGIKAESGVVKHPTDVDKAIAGAENRLADTKQQEPDADYFVGFESGLLRTGTRVMEVAWIVIEAQDGRKGTGVSCGFELRGKMLEQILGGKELSDVIADDFGVSEVGKANGFAGMITNDNLNREESYVQAVIFALAPFLHPEFYTN